MKPEYSFLLVISLLINIIAAYIIEDDNGTFVITAAILFSGYCIVRTIEKQKK